MTSKDTEEIELQAHGGADEEFPDYGDDYAPSVESTPIEDQDRIIPNKFIRDNIVETIWFENTITVAICINCVLLAMENPAKDNALQDFLDGPCEYVFTIIYTIEMLLKMAAWGFFGNYPADREAVDAFDGSPDIGSAMDDIELKAEEHRSNYWNQLKHWICCSTEAEKAADFVDHTEAYVPGLSDDGSYWGYFLDGWNNFDFLIVVCGSYIPLIFPSIGSVGSLRALRVLRPLRTLRTLPKLRVLVSTLISSLIGLFDVCILLGFLFLIFAIGGVTLFKDDLLHRCVPVDENIAKQFSLNNPLTTLEYGVGRFCKADSACPTSSTGIDMACKRQENLNNGISSFRNIAASMGQIFQIVTMEDWTGVMYAIQDSNSPSYWIFFVLCTFTVSFYALNLILAVIVDVYADETKEFHEVADKDNQLDSALAGLSAYETFDRGVSEHEIGVGLNDASYGRRLRELMSQLKQVQLVDAKKLELTPYHMVSFHLRFDGRATILGWSHFKEWRYRSVIAHAVNQACGEDDLYATFRPIDIEFGEMTNRYVTVQVKVREDEDVITVKNAVEKNNGQVICDYFNEHKDLQIESVTKQVIDEGIRLFITFSEGVDSFFLDEDQCPDYDIEGNEGFKREIAEALNEKYGAEFDEEYDPLQMVLTSDLEKDQSKVLVTVSDGKDRNHEWLKFALNDQLDSDPETKMCSVIILTGETFSGEAAAGTSSGIDSNPFAGKERKANIKATDDQVAGLVTNLNADTREVNPFDELVEGDRTFRKQAKISQQRELEDLQETIRSFNRDAANTIMRLSKKPMNAWVDNATLPIVATCNAIGNHWVFKAFIMTCIVANTIVLACVWDGQSDSSKDTTKVLNWVFNFIFIIEAGVLLTGFGFRYYFRDGWNTFDFVLVIVGTVDMIIEMSGGEGDTAALLAFRALRLFRVFRLISRVKSLRVLLMSILEAIAHVSNLLVIFILFLFVFAVLGVQLFAGKLEDADGMNLPWSFDTFWQGFIAAFQLFTGDDWTSMMWIFANRTSNTAIVYFLPTVMCGYFLVMNLFIAILLSRIREQNEYKLAVEDFIIMAAARRDAYEYEVTRTGEVLNPAQRKLIDRRISAFLEKQIARYRKQKQDDGIDAYHRKQRVKRIKHHITGVSLDIFEPEHGMRVMVHNLVHSWYFEWFIIALIITNCAFLAMWNPHISQQKEDDLQIFDYVFTSLFTLEMLLRIFADGLIQGENSYLRDGYNVIDASVVIFSLLSIPISSVKAFRAFRAIRPIRVGIRIKQVRRVIDSLWAAVPQVIQAFFFCMLFYFVFAVLGCHLFMGKLGRCVCDPTALDRSSFAKSPGCINTYDDVYATKEDRATYALFDKEECAAAGMFWEVESFNFDNVFEGLISVYKMGTMSGWWKTMYAGVASRGFEDGSWVAYDYKQKAVPTFFILCVVVAGYFSLNLFISVVVDSFSKTKDNTSGSAILTQKQAIWVRKKRLLDRIGIEKTYVRPTNNPFMLCYDVVTNKWFEPFIMTCIVLNAIVMCFDHEGMSSDDEELLEFINIGFVAVFCAEAVMKITAFGWYDYWERYWNKFDFTIVVISLISMIVNAGGLASIFRTLRIGRIVRLLNKAPVLNALFMTLIFSSPALLNIGSLLFIITFIYAILGITVFGENVQLSHTDFPFIPLQNSIVTSNNPKLEAFNNKINFDSFGNALLVVYRMATGDSWEDVYSGAMIDGWKCDWVKSTDTSLNDGRGCGDQGWALVYFISFGIFGTMIFTNLFIAVILDVYKDNVELEKNLLRLEPLREWKQCWIDAETEWRAKYKKGKNQGFMPVKHFLATLAKVPQLVGLMLDACNLRLQLDENACHCATQEDLVFYGVENWQELLEKMQTEFCGKLGGMPSEEDKNREVQKDHIAAIIESHKWHLICRVDQPDTINDELVVYYDDAVFSMAYLITGPQFPVNRYDSRTECPIAKFWGHESANDDMDEEFDGIDGEDSDDLQDLADAMNHEDMHDTSDEFAEKHE